MTDVNGIEDILAESYDDVGNGGKPVRNIYDGIVKRNRNLPKPQVMNTFLNLVEYILTKDMAQLYGAYDKKNDCEVRWEGSVEEVMGMLRDFIKNFPQEKLEEETVYFFNFEYCFLVWKIEWPEVLKRFGLEENNN